MKLFLILASCTLLLSFSILHVSRVIRFKKPVTEYIKTEISHCGDGMTAKELDQKWPNIKRNDWVYHYDESYYYKQVTWVQGLSLMVTRDTLTTYLIRWDKPKAN